ncbi:MAG: ABC transporter ATP-binding protein [Thermoleophilia bacterium]
MAAIDAPTGLRTAVAGRLGRREGGLVEAAPERTVRWLVRRFWPYARPYRRALAGSLLLVALAPALEAARLWLFKLVVDDVLVPADFGPFVWLAVAYVGLTLAAGLVGFLDEVVSGWAGERFLLGLRTDLFGRLLRGSLSSLERRRLGDTLQRLTGDVDAIEAFVLSGWATAVAYVVELLVFGGLLFLLDWRLALVSLVVAPAFGLLARSFSRRIREASRERRRQGGSLAAAAEERLANALLVQAYAGEERETRRFHGEGIACLQAQLRAIRIRAGFPAAVELVELAGGLTVIALGTYELSRGRLSLGSLLVFLAYLAQLYGPVRGLSRLAATVHAAAAAGERVAELLDERPAVADAPDARRLDRVDGLVELDGVTYTYPGADAPALRDVSLRVEPGRTLAIVGPSGAGKSTVLRLLLRLADPDAGVVRLDGEDARGIELASLRSHLAVVLQETLLFDGTVREAIAYGRPDATDEEIRAAARLADADGFATALPGGYETRVGQRGRSLSGGQRQRLAIARAFLRDAPVLLLDEPTAGLDNASAAHVLGPLRRLRAGRTTILVTHDLDAARDADAIAVVEGGRIVERGTHAELAAAGGAYARLLAARGAAA